MNDRISEVASAAVGAGEAAGETASGRRRRVADVMGE